MDDEFEASKSTRTPDDSHERGVYHVLQDREAAMTILVSLAPPSLSDNESSRAEQVERLVESARRQQDAVLAWLRLNGYAGQYGDVSDPTVFGTFTLSGTEDVLAALRRAPGVVSVVDVTAAPLCFVGTTTP